MSLSADFSAENFQATKQCHDIFKVLKERKKKPLQPRILYLVRLSFRIEGQRKNVPDEQKLKEFITTKLALQEMLKGLL